MKKIVGLLMATLCGVVSLCAADNVVPNGDFAKLDKKGNAVGWRPDAKTLPPVYAAKTDKDPSLIRLAIPENYEGKKGYCVRLDITKHVSPNAKYEFSFKARGIDFEAAKGNVNVLVIREGWDRSVGFAKFKVTSEWKTFKKTVKMVDFKKNAMIVLNGNVEKGALEITDVSLTPVE